MIEDKDLTTWDDLMLLAVESMVDGLDYKTLKRVLVALHPGLKIRVKGQRFMVVWPD